MSENIIFNGKPPVYNGDDDYIFISYSHQDRDLVYEDLWSLANHNINIWYDDGLRAGEVWNETVERIIKSDKCKLVIIYLSDNTIVSTAIRREMDLIQTYKKSYFSIKVGESNLNELVGEALRSMKLDFNDIPLINSFFNKDVIFIQRQSDIKDKAHIDKVINEVIKYGFKTDSIVVNKKDYNKKVLILCKNSSFSNSIINGINDFLLTKENIIVEKVLIDKKLNKIDANSQFNIVLEDSIDNYDGFLIRPIEKYNETTKNLIHKIMNKGKKVVLMDVNMTHEQLSEFATQPSYVGSDFVVGGRIIGQRIGEITNKIGVDDTKIILFEGPMSNLSARTRCESMYDSLINIVASKNILRYSLPSLEERKAIDFISEKSNDWHEINSLVNKNVIIYCGNDNVASSLLKIISSKDLANSFYQSVKEAKKVIVVGYDGIRGANNELVLKNYGLDFLTVDVVPFKQGINVGEKIYGLLFEHENDSVVLTQPELIEYIKFPTEKYDNIDDVEYLFKNKKVIIFDLDGTIADTETLHWEAYNEVLASYNIKLTMDNIKNYIGHSETAIYSMIKKDFNIEFDDEQFISKRISLYLELVKKKNLKPFAFIKQILNKYNYMKFAIVTSQIPMVVNKVLEYMEIDSYFPPENRFCCHDGKNKKIDIYQDVSKYLKLDYRINASNVLLLEDSNHYISLAKDLGLTVIGVEHRYNYNSLASCDAIITKNVAKGLFVGLCGMDIIYYNPSKLPEDNSKKKIYEYLTEIGGPAANAAITYSILGGEAYLLCSIGNSEMGLLIKSMLKKFNIHIIDISSEYNNISNISSIYVNTENGDRTILSGQHKFKIPAQLSLKDIVKKCKFVLYDGNLNGIENELLQCVECYDKELVLDAGSYKTGFPECFYHATTVISSEGYKDLNGCDVFDLQKSYDYKYAAKTRGKNSILYMEDGTIKEMDVVDVKTIDTLGAGDILHGAYCFFRYVKKLDFKNSLKMASNIASFSTTKRGVIEGLKYAKNEFIDEIL